MDGFLLAVQGAWNSEAAVACPMQRLYVKLRSTSRALQAWSHKKVGKISAQLDEAQELFHRLDIAQDIRPLSEEEAWLRQQVKRHSLALASLHRTILLAHSRLDWLGEGDANTSFFHAHARYRKLKNFIATLHVDDRVVTTHHEQEEVIWEFYHRYLGTPEHRTPSLNLAYFHHEGHDLSALDVPISEEEVWNAIKDMPLDKAPRPDGFTGRFYRSCWTIIKHDVMAAIGGVHGGDTRGLQLLNSAYMVLIPKKEEATMIGDYRPISLVHSFVKLLT